MDQHLQSGIHGMSKEDEEYHKLLKKSERFFPVDVPTDINSSPKKQYGLRERPQTRNDILDDTESDTDNDYGVDDETDEETNDEVDENDKELSEKLEDYLRNFIDYMTGPNRGRKSTSVAEVARDVRRIFRKTGAKTCSDLLKEDLDFLHKTYIVNYCQEKNMKPGSIKKYLASLRDFVQYLIFKGGIPGDASVEYLVKVDYQLSNWRKNYRKKDSLQRHHRATEDLEMLVTSDQVAKYESSDDAKCAKEILHKLKVSQHELNQTEYCCLRDYLLITIGFSNAHRSGVPAHMLISEFEKAKKIRDDIHEIKVWDHKTVHYYGPALVTLNSTTFEYLSLFVMKARPQVKNITATNVFLSWGGKSMKSGDVSKRLHVNWERAGNFTEKTIPKNLSQNHVRKSATTGLRARNSDFSKQAAHGMMHSEKTASIHYHLIEQQEATVQGANAIQNMFYEKSSTRKNWSKEEVQTLVKDFGTENVSFDAVKERCRSVDLNASPRQIYDKIRNLRKHSVST